jgi:hypothetical protein
MMDLPLEASTMRKVLLLTLAAATAMPAHPDGDAAGSHRFYEVRGSKLYVETFGSGTPIVFLHGGLHFFDNSFDKQREYFASFRKVVGIDQRGHGHSPDSGAPFSYREMAEDTAALIEQLGVGPADVVGHSGITRSSCAVWLFREPTFERGYRQTS